MERLCISWKSLEAHVKKSESINELAKSLCKAQSEMRGAIKDSANPFFKSKYADLESVWDAIRKPLTDNELTVAQTTEYDNEAGISIVTTLMHSSGQWIQGSLPIMAVKKDPQGVGSAITYSRRYALAAMVGLVQVDDDAESVSYTHLTLPTIYSV